MRDMLVPSLESFRPPHPRRVRLLLRHPSRLPRPRLPCLLHVQPGPAQLRGYHRLGLCRCFPSSTTRRLHPATSRPWAALGLWALGLEVLRLPAHPPPHRGRLRTEEGWNRGDNPSGDTCQVGELTVGGCLPLDHSLRAPPPPDTSCVPINALSYSDDRCLLHATLPGLIHLTRLCIRATVANGGLVHMDKLQFYAFDIYDGRRRLLTLPVPYYGAVTQQPPPPPPQKWRASPSPRTSHPPLISPTSPTRPRSCASASTQLLSASSWPSGPSGLSSCPDSTTSPPQLPSFRNTSPTLPSRCVLTTGWFWASPAGDPRPSLRSQLSLGGQDAQVWSSARQPDFCLYTRRPHFH